MWSECIPHNAHVVRVSHNMMYQSMRSTRSVCFQYILPRWSECIMICRINLCCPYSQHVTPHGAHVVRVYHHILPTWSECIPCIAHVVSVSHHILRAYPGMYHRIYCPHLGVSRHASYHAMHRITPARPYSYQSIYRAVDHAITWHIVSGAHQMDTITCHTITRHTITCHIIPPIYVPQKRRD